MDTKNTRLTDASILPFPHVSPNNEQVLHTVINNMSQGLLLFDAEQTLVICNRRYIEMYGLSQEDVKPGCTLRELLNSRRQVGTFSGNPEEHVAKIMECIGEGETFSNVIKLPNDRVISLVSKPVIGGGWLAMHEDITERQCAEE